MENSFTLVGKIKDAHGIRGDLFAISFSEDLSWTDDLSKIFLSNSSDENPVVSDLERFDISNLRIHKKTGKAGILFQIKSIKNRNDAEKLKGLYLYVDKPLELYDHQEREFVGYKLLDKERGEIGVVVDIGGSSMQATLIVKLEDKEFEVPFVEPLVSGGNDEDRIIETDLPFGLLPGEDV